MTSTINPAISQPAMELDEITFPQFYFGSGTDCTTSQYHPLNFENDQNIQDRIHKIHFNILKEKYKSLHSILSRRELEIVYLICNGKKTEEISKILHLSKHTVESHRTKIFSKLNVHNAMELVALAFRVGLVR